MNLENCLKKLLNDSNATFKKDQKEAIQLVLKGKKLLVVEKTGWGKSMVYFIATKIRREKGYGPTIIISPLLSLMRNQVESAEKLGLKAYTINSTNAGKWEEINNIVSNDECDVLLISPEKLSNKEFRENTMDLIKGGIGLLVIDEAHCISDWGHDFRPDYKRIKSILKSLTENVPVLATTATANKRVIDDICIQVGAGMEVLRGSLLRESLILENLQMQSEEEKLAWVAYVIPKLPGSGIIYCSTTSKCVRVSEWLNKNGISSTYYFGTGLTTEEKKERERLLIENEVKVIVATNALGMGFDKPDIRFVIHYQKPGSLIAYYQQIGRAGRDGKESYIALLDCNLDNSIQTHFIKGSFPDEETILEILEIIEDNPVSENELSEALNISISRLSLCLKILQIEGAITEEDSGYTRTPNKWYYDKTKIDEIIKNKLNEFDKLNEFANTKKCLMKFIQKQLDDKTDAKCGKCSNCDKPRYNIKLGNKLTDSAKSFLNEENKEIKIKKKWPNLTNIGKPFLISKGFLMTRYKEGLIGNKVFNERYTDEKFSEELILKAAEFIKSKPEYMDIKWVTCVPSLKHPCIVPDFAILLSEKLDLPFHQVIYKNRDTTEQKDMKNKFQQVSNIYDSFDIRDTNFDFFNEPVLLVDDIVNSGWTFTICAYHLLNNKSGPVIPFALTGTENGGN